MTLLNLRIYKQWTQEEVAKRTGIPYESYRRYENGRGFPKYTAIIALSKLYNMSPGELFDMLIGYTHPED